MVVDINGDNKADIIGFNAKGIEVSLSRSGSTYASFYTQNLVFDDLTKHRGWSSQENYPKFFEDINNDGYKDLIGFGYSSVYTFIGFNPDVYDLSSFKSTSVTESIGQIGNFDEKEEDMNFNLELFPNPTIGALHMKSDSKIHSIAIYDYKGSIVLSKSDINSMSISIDLSNLNQGLYMIRLESEKGVRVEKILKN
jgi:hypothetical protein